MGDKWWDETPSRSAASSVSRSRTITTGSWFTCRYLDDDIPKLQDDPSKLSLLLALALGRRQANTLIDSVLRPAAVTTFAKLIAARKKISSKLQAAVGMDGYLRLDHFVNSWRNGVQAIAGRFAGRNQSEPIIPLVDLESMLQAGVASGGWMYLLQISQSGSQQDAAISVPDLVKHVHETKMDRKASDFAAELLEFDWKAWISRNKDKKCSLFAILDGHESHLVPFFVRENFPFILCMQPEFESGDFETALSKAVVKTHELLRSWKDLRIEGFANVIGGTTFVAALSSNTHVHFACLGDSFGVLMTPEGEVIRVTKTHDLKEIDKDMKERFLASGMPGLSLDRYYDSGNPMYEGKYVFEERDMRIGPSGLQMIGSLGDFLYDLDLYNAYMRLLIKQKLILQKEAEIAASEEKSYVPNVDMIEENKDDPDFELLRKFLRLTDARKGFHSKYLSTSCPIEPKELEFSPHYRTPFVASFPIESVASFILCSDGFDRSRATALFSHIREFKEVCSLWSFVDSVFQDDSSFILAVSQRFCT